MQTLSTTLGLGHSMYTSLSLATIFHVACFCFSDFFAHDPQCGFVIVLALLMEF